jgi:hypothetical protein
MGQLSIDQTDHMTPGLEGAALGFRVVLARQSRHQMVGNQVAQLPQESESAARWLAVSFVLHDLPCGRLRTCKPTFFQTRSIHLSTLWDSVGSFPFYFSNFCFHSAA